MAKKRVVARVEGMVQGVFFRDYIQKEARSLELSGTVETVLEGEAANVAKMIAWLHLGSPQAKVHKVLVNEEQPLGDKSAFIIRYN